MAKRKKTKGGQSTSWPTKQNLPLSELLAHRPNWVALGVFAFLIVIFFADVLFGNKIFFVPDMKAHSALARKLNELYSTRGIYSLWSPYIFCGMPSFASFMFTKFAYLPYIILDFLKAVLPLPLLFAHVVHYPVAGMGVYLYLRDRQVSLLPAVLGGIAFMFTPYLITMEAFGHGSQMMTTVYMPLALWAVDRLLRRGGMLYIGIAALVLGIQLQRAHVQIVYYTWLLIGAYILYYIFQRIQESGLRSPAALQAVGKFVLVAILALGMAAMLYLPIYEYMPYSIRGAGSALAPAATAQKGVGFEYATQWSFSPGEMMTFLIPSFLGFGGRTYWGSMPFTDYPNYMGILVLLLAVFAVAHRRRPLAIFFTVMIVLALLVSFGKHFSPLYKLLYNYLPFFNRFRVPVMILVVVQMSVAILAGLGFQKLLDLIKELKETARQVLATRLLMIAGGIILLALLLTIGRGGFFNIMRGIYPDQYPENVQLPLDMQRFDLLFADWWLVSVWVAGGLALLALAFRGKVSVSLFSLGILVITIADLWFVDYKLNKPVPKTFLDSYLESDELTRALNADSSLYRIFPVGQLFGENRWAAQGLQSIGGYHAAKPRAYQDFLDATGLERQFAQKYFRVATQNGRRVLVPKSPDEVDQARRIIDQNLIDFLNVKYILSPFPLPEAAFVLRGQYRIYMGNQPVKIYVYENGRVLPRATLVGEARIAEHAREALALVRSKQFDPRKRVILYQEPEIPLAPDESARATIRSYSNHEFRIETTAKAGQILVLADTFFPPGWQAHLDGQPVPILQANHAFRAVAVPAGSHEIVFTFHSRAFSLGMWLTVASTLLVFACITWGALRRRRAESVAAGNSAGAGRDEPVPASH